jgi:L-fuculose-phosphate aldolase
MTNKENIIRKKIIESALDLDKKGLNQCKAGNISVRWKKGMLITPSGMEYNKLRPEDIVYVENNFKAHGKRKPSIETPFHMGILKNKKDVNTIIHTHAPYGTGLSLLGKTIPCYHYMIAFFGGDSIKCAKFELPGSYALAKETVKVLKNRKACLLANHGIIVTGNNISEALHLAEELEVLCKQITIAKINGTPKLVRTNNMKKVLEAIKTYGKQ